jgi:hypothetical protein
MEVDDNNNAGYYVSLSEAGVTLDSIWDNSGAADCEYITTFVYSAVYDYKAVDDG